MTRATRSTIAGLALLAVALPARSAYAQGKRTDADRYPEQKVTLELFAGLADYGRFLEQYRTIDDFIGQREVTASTAFTLGGSVAAHMWEKTAVRLGFTWSPTDLEYDDDTGFETDILDLDDLADLSAYVLSLDVMQFLLEPTRRWTPYGSLGITAAWWSLDDESGAIFNDGTQFRWGGTGSVGVQLRVDRHWGGRLEIATMGLGNPFDGDDAFVTTTGTTFDEPSAVRLSRITLALTYSFLRR